MKPRVAEEWALDADCPRCHVLPGEPRLTTRTGEPRYAAHLRRVELARLAVPCPECSAPEGSHCLDTPIRDGVRQGHAIRHPDERLDEPETPTLRLVCRRHGTGADVHRLIGPDDVKTLQADGRCHLCAEPMQVVSPDGAYTIPCPKCGEKALHPCRFDGGLRVRLAPHVPRQLMEGEPSETPPPSKAPRPVIVHSGGRPPTKARHDPMLIPLPLEPLHVTCPRCLAPPDRGCTTGKRAPLPEPHKRRKERVKRAWLRTCPLPACDAEPKRRCRNGARPAKRMHPIRW